MSFNRTASDRTNQTESRHPYVLERADPFRAGRRTHHGRGVKSLFEIKLHLKVHETRTATRTKIRNKMKSCYMT
jgi:hypothetical protein